MRCQTRFGYLLTVKNPANLLTSCLLPKSGKAFYTTQMKLLYSNAKRFVKNQLIDKNLPNSSPFPIPYSPFPKKPRCLLHDSNRIAILLNYIHQGHQTTKMAWIKYYNENGNLIGEKTTLITTEQLDIQKQNQGIDFSHTIEKSSVALDLPQPHIKPVILPPPRKINLLYVFGFDIKSIASSNSPRRR